MRIAGLLSGALADLRALPREVHTVFAVDFLNSYRNFGFRAVQYQYLTNEFGADDVEAGAVLGTEALLKTIFALVGALLVDKIGVRRTAITSLLISVVGRGVLALTASKSMAIFALTTLTPAGEALLSTGIYTVALKKLTTERTRAVAFGVQYAVFNMAGGMADVMADALRSRDFASPLPAALGGGRVWSGLRVHVLTTWLAVVLCLLLTLRALHDITLVELPALANGHGHVAVGSPAAGCVDDEHGTQAVARFELGDTELGAVSSTRCALGLGDGSERQTAALGCDGVEIPANAQAQLGTSSPRAPLISVHAALSATATEGPTRVTGAPAAALPPLTRAFSGESGDLRHGVILSRSAAENGSSALLRAARAGGVSDSAGGGGAGASEDSDATAVPRPSAADRARGYMLVRTAAAGSALGGGSCGGAGGRREHGARRRPLAAVRGACRALQADLGALLRLRAFWRALAASLALVPLSKMWSDLDQLLPAFLERTEGEGVPIFQIHSINLWMCLVLPPCVAAATSAVEPFRVMLPGVWLMALSPLPLVVFPGVAAAVCWVVLLSLGEAFWSPRLSAWVAGLAPAGREGAFLALVSLKSLFTALPANALNGYLNSELVPNCKGCRDALGRFCSAPISLAGGGAVCGSSAPSGRAPPVACAPPAPALSVGASAAEVLQLQCPRTCAQCPGWEGHPRLLWAAVLATAVCSAAILTACLPFLRGERCACAGRTLCRAADDQCQGACDSSDSGAGSEPEPGLGCHLTTLHGPLDSQTVEGGRDKR